VSAPNPEIRSLDNQRAGNPILREPASAMNTTIDLKYAENEAACDSARLIDPDAARTRICSSVTPILEVELLPMAAALGRVLAENIRSRYPLPRFDNAAMDGFAIHPVDLDSESPVRLSIVGAVRPGDCETTAPRPGAVVTITTGAPVPANTGAVIAVERATLIAENALLVPRMPRAGTNIRRVAEDVAAGEVIATAGTIIDARHIALMVAAGVSRVLVRRKLRVCVISTGNELVDIGCEPATHQVIDTNRPALMALLDRPAIERVDGGIVPDRPDELRVALATASQCDLIVSTGGVSGSESDHVAAALIAGGGRADLLRLAIKPGKPLLSGSIGSAFVLGLAGNPVAAMVSFLLFGRPLTWALLGAVGRGTMPVPARTACEFKHRPGRTEFVPVDVESVDCEGFPRLQRLGSGGSANLSPLAAADGFAEIPSMANNLQIGHAVKFHPVSTLLYE
jgi:molybdopterin molybdotransferase